jgi:hypothetical protein
VDTDVALASYDTAIGTLQRAGWSPAAALEVMAALDYIVLGSAQLPFARGFARPPAEYADRYPALASSLSDAELDAVDDRGFELALGLFLDGLIHRGPAS